jgi:hypothetical protein
MICGPEVCASRMWVCHVARRKARKVVERVVEMRERWVCSVGSKAMVGGVVNAVMGGEVGRKREGGEVWKFLVCVGFCCSGRIHHGDSGGTLTWQRGQTQDTYYRSAWCDSVILSYIFIIMKDCRRKPHDYWQFARLVPTLSLIHGRDTDATCRKVVVNHNLSYLKEKFNKAGAATTYTV